MPAKTDVGKNALEENGFELKRSRPLTDGILNLIWREKQISRAEIARLTGLAKSTVSENIAQLLKSDLIRESGTGISAGGRQPIILEFQDDSCCILGVEIGASHVAVSLTDLRGRVLAWSEQDHDVRSDPVGTRSLVIELCDNCMQSWDKGHDKLVGIGVAVPSPVDPNNPDLLSEVVIPAWEGHVGLQALRDKYQVPLFVDNDANLGALAEYWWGAGSGIDDFIYIKAATGIGAGYILGGQIYKGGSGFAGEIGHLSVDPAGKACICGLKGCLVTQVGADALVENARSLLDRFPDSVLQNKDLGMSMLESAAMNADPLAMEVVQEAAQSFGTAIAGLMNIMNPNAVILGGSLAGLGVLLLDPLREAVHSRTNISTNVLTEIKVSLLGQRSVAIGASTLVLKESLENPRLFPEIAE